MLLTRRAGQSVGPLLRRNCSNDFYKRKRGKERKRRERERERRGGGEKEKEGQRDEKGI